MKKLVFIVAIFSLSTQVSAQEKSIQEMHAFMMYNFVKYIQWPDESGAGEFKIGILGDEMMYGYVKQICDGKLRGDKKYVVKKLSTASEASTCQVVYLSKSKNSEFDAIRGYTNGKPILTVTEGVGLAQKGSFINFIIVDSKLRFELNPDMFIAADMKVSKQLTTMAVLINQ